MSTPGKPVTDNERQQVIRLAAQKTLDGRPLLGLERIAREMDLSTPTVRKILREAIIKAYES